MSCRCGPVACENLIGTLEKKGSLRGSPLIVVCSEDYLLSSSSSVAGSLSNHAPSP